jgi:hypothetical protein
MMVEQGLGDGDPKLKIGQIEAALLSAMSMRSYPDGPDLRLAPKLAWRFEILRSWTAAV